MRKLALVLVTLAAGHPAFAADMPLKAPPPPPLPFYSWTGFYLGGNVGGAWTSDWSASYAPLPSPAAFGGAPGTLDLSGSAIVGGGQAGYNWQFSDWVIGFEGDYTAMSLHAAGTAQSLLFPSFAPVPGEFQTMSRSLNWLASARGRLGWAWDRTLLYVTGGAAWGSFDYTADKNVLAGPGFTFPASLSTTKSGWVAGAGVEYALPGTFSGLTVRAEYQFYGFNGTSIVVREVPATIFSRGYTWNDADVQIVRGAINYKF
jgi:outer membrane immunogenic protein